MSKRLQVVMDDRELAETESVARSLGMTVSEWVRSVIRAARSEVPAGDADRKLAAVRTAARYEGPTADIGPMLAEIEAGYGRGLPE